MTETTPRLWSLNSCFTLSPPSLIIYKDVNGYEDIGDGDENGKIIGVASNRDDNIEYTISDKCLGITFSQHLFLDGIRSTNFFY